MDERTEGAAGAHDAPVFRRLRDVRMLLLRLHKVLLDDERAGYERVHGQVQTSGELLQLVLHDERFAWLRALSELIVRVDEMFAAVEPATPAAAAALLAQTRALLTPDEAGDEFARKYFAAIQREPAAVLLNKEVRRLVTE
ncbi:MAG TPA: hypothetical protein VF546_20325 [Pyrinomonadaceae bacterium]|jgi:hypothetical protein